MNIFGSRSSAEIIKVKIWMGSSLMSDVWSPCKTLLGHGNTQMGTPGKTPEEDSHLQAKKIVFEEINPTKLLSSDFQAPEFGEMNQCSISPPGFGAL